MACILLPQNDHCLFRVSLLLYLTYLERTSHIAHYYSIKMKSPQLLMFVDQSLHDVLMNELIGQLLLYCYSLILNVYSFFDWNRNPEFVVRVGHNWTHSQSIDLCEFLYFVITLNHLQVYDLGMILLVEYLVFIENAEVNQPLTPVFHFSCLSHLQGLFENRHGQYCLICILDNCTHKIEQ